MAQPRHGMDLERVVALGQPALRNLAQLLGRCRVEHLQRAPIATGVAFEHLAGGQHVGLAAEPADPLESLDEPGADRGAGARQLSLGRTLGDEALHFLVDGRLDSRMRHAGLDVGRDAEQPGDLEAAQPGADRVGDPLAIDEPLVEPGRLAAAEDLPDDRQQLRIERAVRRGVPETVQARLGHLVVHDLARALGARRNPGARPVETGAGRDVPEIFLGLLTCRRQVDVAGQHEHDVGRAIVGAEPLMDVVQRGRVEILHRADRQPAVRMARREARAEDRLPDPAERAVLALALLVLDDAPLLVEALLRDDAEQVAHPVRLHPERHVERGGRHVLEVIGPVEAGRAVLVRGTHRLERLEELVVEVLRALEHQVLEKVCEARPARPLVLRADVVPEVHGDDRGLAIGVDDDR